MNPFQCPVHSDQGREGRQRIWKMSIRLCLWALMKPSTPLGPFWLQVRLQARLVSNRQVTGIWLFVSMHPSSTGDCRYMWVTAWHHLKNSCLHNSSDVSPPQSDSLLCFLKCTGPPPVSLSAGTPLWPHGYTEEIWPSLSQIYLPLALPDPWDSHRWRAEPRWKCAVALSVSQIDLDK